MPYRDERYRRRARKRNRIVTIVVLALLVEIIVMIVLLSHGCSSRRGTPDITSQQTAPTATETPVPADTPAPTEEPTPVPTPAMRSYAVDGYLPIYQKLEMDEKIIAITVDDLGQPENLKQICQIAADSNAKLTLFPVGKMLENSEVRSTVKHAYEDLGFEIENHTYGHNKLYMLSDSEMAEAIFKQQQMVSSVLGVNYQMHFLRMPGGNGETDPRSHQYLDQLGYRGIVNWSYSSGGVNISTMKKHLRPGIIYLFHTTSKDLRMLSEFRTCLHKMDVL